MMRRVSRGGARETHVCGLAHLQQCSCDVGSQGNLIINSTLEGDRETGSQGRSQHVQELCANYKLQKGLPSEQMN